MPHCCNSFQLFTLSAGDVSSAFRPSSVEPGDRLVSTFKIRPKTFWWSISVSCPVPLPSPRSSQQKAPSPCWRFVSCQNGVYPFHSYQCCSSYCCVLCCRACEFVLYTYVALNCISFLYCLYTSMICFSVRNVKIKTCFTQSLYAGIF